MYKKIFIKNKEDLPKEVGDYIVKLKNGNARFLHFPFKGDVGYTICQIEWLNDVDWYLIESPITIPTEEESETEGDRLGERQDSNRKIYIDGNYTEGFEDCYKWMHDEIIKRNK